MGEKKTRIHEAKRPEPQQTNQERRKDNTKKDEVAPTKSRQTGKMRPSQKKRRP